MYHLHVVVDRHWECDEGWMLSSKWKLCTSVGFVTRSHAPLVVFYERIIVIYGVAQEGLSTRVRLMFF